MTTSVHDAVSPFAGSPIATPGGLIPDGMYPAGYTMKVVRDATVVAHGSTMEYFDEMLYAHPTVYEWASTHPMRRALQGRMTAYAVPLPHDEDISVVVRHSHHGGLLASVTSDVFRDPRAADELRISWTLRHVGIPTPRVLGYVLYPLAFGQLWRADVVTREVTNSRDLASILSDDALPREEHERAIDTTITLLRKLARTWAYHKDLNVKNILIETEVDEPPPPPPPPPAAVKPSKPDRPIPAPVPPSKLKTSTSADATSRSTPERGEAVADAPPVPATDLVAPTIRQMAYVLDVDTLRFAEKKAEWMNVARLIRSAKKWQEKEPKPGFALLIEKLGG